MDPRPGLLLAMSGSVYQPCHQHPALRTVFELCVTAPGMAPGSPVVLTLELDGPAPASPGRVFLTAAAAVHGHIT